MLYENGAPFPAGGRVPKMISEKIDSRENTIFGSLRVHDWFCGPKTNVFSSQKPSERDDGLRAVPNEQKILRFVIFELDKTSRFVTFHS